jgi:hypothetical protein
MMGGARARFSLELAPQSMALALWSAPVDAATDRRTT